jgi:predicted aldo/keto reductase-like oxidoreductase
MLDPKFVESMPKLGFGLMRLPMKDGEIDIPQTCEMADMFMAKGFTYFDTAYVYDGGDSEIATRKALVERYPRDAFTVTTKANA